MNYKFTTQPKHNDTMIKTNNLFTLFKVPKDSRLNIPALINIQFGFDVEMRRYGKLLCKAGLCRREKVLQVFKSEKEYMYYFDRVPTLDEAERAIFSARAIKHLDFVKNMTPSQSFNHSLKMIFAMFIAGSACFIAYTKLIQGF